MTIELAHKIMQAHLACLPGCQARAAALETLEDEGHYRLAKRYG